MMSFRVSEVNCGFRLENESRIPEIDSVCRLFVHEKTGARLLNVFNTDDNKVFSIAFRTPPADHTGIAHILEHSVLCGSRKFPGKEPFVELIKGSLNTFLNALTFPDKTMYPVASRNEKDFINLMDVYLDAVLYPNIYRKPEILMQEGWHHELINQNDPLTLKGVVYNEMKGAYSTPERILFSRVRKELYPDGTYGRDSGGDPEFIPELTSERFLEFHSKYYHPSNSYIFIYGNLEIEKALKFIDENYLSSFERISLDSRIILQKPFEKPLEKSWNYPVSPDDNTENRSYLAQAFCLGKSGDPVSYLAYEILRNLLLEMPGAPLKEALIKAGIGSDVLSYYDESSEQPVFVVAVKNTSPEKKEIFKNTVREVLEKISEKGFDPQILEAGINRKEFELKEADQYGYPKGLLFNFICMDTWLYDQDPLTHFRFDKTLSELRKQAEQGYFEQLIRKAFLDNNHSLTMILNPVRGLQQENEKKTAEKLQKHKEALTEKQLDEIIHSTENLIKLQSAPDSPEDLEKIPLLMISDIPESPEKILSVPGKIRHSEVISYPQFTGGITYLNLYFDLGAVPQEKLSCASLLAGLLSKISTENSHYSELSRKINTYTGGIDFYCDVMHSAGGDEFLPFLVVSGKSLDQKFDLMTDIMTEIFTRRIFDDRARILEVIKELKSRTEMYFAQSGNAVAASRIRSYYSKEGRCRELLRGIDFYRYLKKIETEYESCAFQLSADLEEVSKAVFTQKNLRSCYISGKEFSEGNNGLSDLVAAVPEGNTIERCFDFSESAGNEGIIYQGQVQYVGLGDSFRKYGFDYSGKLQVLKTVVALDFLWNRVRVRGGAYGAHLKLLRNGETVFTSYRDPNLGETLQAYREIPEFVRNFSCSERELQKYIVGTVGKMDNVIRPFAKSDKAFREYLSGISYEDLKKERWEVLSCTSADIKNCTALLHEIVSKGRICVVGAESQIEKNKDIFCSRFGLFG